MEKKTWAMIVRMLNMISSLTLIGFQVWFVVQLFLKSGVGQIIVRIFAPAFLFMMSLLIISSEYKYKKVVQYFKFLQSLVGLGMFNLFLASILSLQFSTLHQTFSIIVSVTYIVFGLTFLILSCLKPKSQIDDQEMTVGLK